MQYFPKDIVKSLRQNKTSSTCLPVRLDQHDWETAAFFELGGSHSKSDRMILRKLDSAVPVGIEGDVIEQSTAAIVVLRFEIHTQPENPLALEVLLAPGNSEIEFKTLENLGQQSHLRMFFADNAYRIIHSQQITLHPEMNNGFKSLLGDAVKHDAMIRMTQRYDAKNAMKDVTSHYQNR